MFPRASLFLLPVILASAAIPLVAVSGCNAVGEGPPCAALEAYPVCENARTGVLSCQDGEEIFTPCDDELTCLDLVDPTTGERLSACQPDTSFPCDPAEFLSACLGSSTVLACVASVDHPNAGHTEILPCAEGEECRLDGDHGVCLPSIDPLACDATTFPGACVGGAPVTCIDGTLTTGAPCAAPDETCVVGADGAACVPARACDPLSWTSTCASDTTLTTCTAAGEVATQSCPVLGTVCVQGTNGAVCVPPGTEPCNPATFVSHCQGMGWIVTCDPRTGLPVESRCGRSGRCIQSRQGATCQ